MNLLALRAVAVLALVGAVLLGLHRWVSEIKTDGAASCQRDHSTMVAQQAQAVAAAASSALAEQTRLQAAMDAKEQAYANAVETLRAAAAARASDADRLRGQLADVAGRARSAASAPGTACSAENQRLAGCADLLAEGAGLAEQGRGLVESLNAKIQALQSACNP